jgi:hypothetical protein
MPISDARLLELAISGLEAQRARIDEEVAQLQARARGLAKVATVEAAKVKSRKGRRKMTLAEKKAHSERMKKIWAARKRAQR